MAHGPVESAALDVRTRRRAAGTDHEPSAKARRPAAADLVELGSRVAPGEISLPTVRCAGVPVARSTLMGAAGEIVRVATSASESGVDVHLCNAYTVALADSDEAYRRMLGEASLNLPDGKPVVWANRWRRGRDGMTDERVRGTDLLLETFAQGQECGLRHFLLGATPAVLDDMQRELASRFPEALIAGAEAPPFRELSDREWRAQAGRIGDSGAQVVWVGLGTPKQDWEAARLRARLPVVAVGVGAAFDFLAGVKREAPAWVQRSGFEWAHRLATEPRRLWRRYLFGNARFVYATCMRGD